MVRGQRSELERLQTEQADRQLRLEATRAEAEYDQTIARLGEGLRVQNLRARRAQGPFGANIPNLLDHASSFREGEEVIYFIFNDDRPAGSYGRLNENIENDRYVFYKGTIQVGGSVAGYNGVAEDPEIRLTNCFMEDDLAGIETRRLGFTGEQTVAVNHWHLLMREDEARRIMAQRRREMEARRAADRHPSIPLEFSEAELQ